MGSAYSEPVYNRDTMIYDKKIHIKVLCAALICLKKMNTLPLELISIIINNMNALLYFYVLNDAFNNGWEYHEGSTLLLPQIGRKVRDYPFEYGEIFADGTLAPHWIFDTRLRRDSRKSDKKCETKTFSITNFHFGRDGYPYWIEEFHSMRYIFPIAIVFNPLRKIQLCDLIYPGNTVTVTFDDLRRIHKLNNFSFHWS